MTLHSAKGLEFDTVFLPGWEEGLFPHQRSLDDQGRAGLEEERRLAHVGLTRARKRAKIYFATNRRIHGLWPTNIPSRFLDELPEAHVEVTEAAGGSGGFGMSGYGPRASTRWARSARAIRRPAGSARRRARERAASARPARLTARPVAAAADGDTPDGVFDQRSDYDDDAATARITSPLGERSTGRRPVG